MTNALTEVLSQGGGKVTKNEYWGLKSLTYRIKKNRKAHYVIGSDVYGPMGKELIPFEKKAEAEEFLKDHRGERIIPFEGITPDVIQRLD